MKKRYFAASILVLGVLLVGLSAVFLLGLLTQEGSPPPTTRPSPTPTQTPPTTNSPTTSPTPTITPTNANGPITYTYTVVNTYPHSTDAYTEGLVYDNGVFFESTGEYGTSTLRRVEVTTGHVTREYRLPDEYFAEGLTVVNDSLVQLTWQNNIGFVYDKATFDVKSNFSYSTEGWGLTFDGSRLIQSDGSPNLYFLDPNTFQRIGQISVHDGNNAVANLNELEYFNGDIYANIWLQQKIVIIDPASGAVKGYIDLSGLYQSSDPNQIPNGIAYDAQNNRLFVTGKYWPNLYEIRLSPKV